MLRLETVEQPEVGDVLAALSRALDLVEGQPQGHAFRSARIAVATAKLLGLDEAFQLSIYYASLLKDAGCSNNSARIHAIFGGDETVAKRNVKVIDWTNPLQNAVYGVSHAERGAPLRVRLQKVAELARGNGNVMDEVTAARCTRGADIARYLGFDSHVIDGVRCLDEHWDGRGSPAKLRGEAIPLSARILCLAQTLEVFVTTYGVAAGYRMLRSRRGKWFDPSVVDAAIGLERDIEFWSDHASHLAGEHLSPPIPASALVKSLDCLDRVCEAFAQIVDAKSTFTAEHSTRVTSYAVAIGTGMGLSSVQITDLRRAALLHDIGKLGVPNSILDKPGKLTDEEFSRIREHPKFSEEILSHIRGFERVTAIAAAHHERLDGRGYHRGVDGDQLSMEMRILAVSDVFDALSAERPYREALPLEKVFEIMDRDLGTAFDGDAVTCLRELAFGDKLPKAA